MRGSSWGQPPGVRRPPGGFSLLETVATLGLFLIVVITVINLYLTYSRAQRIGSQRQKVVTEANLLLDQLAREIRVHELAYGGTFNYDNVGSSETLYRVDVDAAEGGNPYANTNIYQRERELVIYDAQGDETASNDTVFAYVFNRRDAGGVVDVCADAAGALLFPVGTAGLFRLSRAGTAATVCERVFNIPGLDVVDAGFFFSQPFQPYPDDVDPATDIRSGDDADCGPGAEANFNGSVCTCTVATQAAACFSGNCSTTTGGQCTFGPNRQPAVTVFFTVQDANNPATRLTFQTTVTGRLYKR